MKLTPSLLLTCFLISISSLLFAQSININTAKEIAKNHLLSVGKNNLKSASPNQAKIQFSSLSVTSESKDTLYFVLNDTINHSFVIVAADKRSRPIIGYSLESSYNVNNQPPAFVAWMENWKQEITDIKKNNLQPDSATTAKWNNLMNTDLVSDSISVEPLLTTKWNQEGYYNTLCPYDNQAYSRTPTGCTATAMAQIMKYWNFPTVGTGNHTYYSNYGYLSADFGSTTYQWDQMTNDVVSPNEAVATLMFHCGVAVNMNYGPQGSGAPQPRDALVNYFKYSPEARFVYHKSFSESDWINLLKSELNAHRPIWYQGLSSGKPHAFVLDGYQNNDYFHFNWGWGGIHDGYFSLVASTDLNTGAIIGLSPGSDSFDGLFLPTDTLSLGTNGGTASVNVFSSVNWSASSNQTWLSLNPSSGVPGTSSINLIATENKTGNNRSATVTILVTGHNDQLITVNQPINLSVTSGEMNNIIGNMTTPITNLTLTGTIDVRDFITMRDKMPALTEVDLSDVTIVEYVGTKGTLEWSNTYPANSIPYKAFCDNKKLKNVIVPASVTSIESTAFSGCSGLTSVTIPSSVTSIGGDAFRNCFNLASFTIPSSIKSIRTEVFHGCSRLSSMIIPPSVISIENYAFWECTGLTSVTIPSSVISIGNKAFYGCSGLNSIFAYPISPVDLNSSSDVFLYVKKSNTILQVPFGTKNAYQEANQWKDFKNIIEMPGLFLSGNMLTMGASADTLNYNIASSTDWTATSDQAWLTIDHPSGISGSHTISFTASANSNTAIRTAIVTVSSTGHDSQTITITQYAKVEVTAGNLKTILEGSLSTVTSLTLIGTIDARDFKIMRDKMPALTEIDLSNVTIVNYTGTEGTKGSASSTYPANEIPIEAFRGKIGLRTIAIPSSTTSIEKEAFYSCKELTNIEIPSSVTFIGGRAFGICSAFINVDSVNPNYLSVDGVLFNKDKTALIQCPTTKSGEYAIPQSVTSIGEQAFSICIGLTKVTIPSSVSSIGAKAFMYCTGLNAIYVSSKYPVNLNASKDVFYDVNKYTCTLYVPLGSKGVYQASDQWQDFTKIVEKDLSLSNEQIVDFNNLDFEIYPNPTSGKVKIILAKTPQNGTELIVTDINGKIVLEQTIQEKEEWIDLTGNTPGVYLLKTNLKNTNVQKVILK
jgi:hypothetical protein